MMDNLGNNDGLRGYIVGYLFGLLSGILVAGVM